MAFFWSNLLWSARDDDLVREPGEHAADLYFGRVEVGDSTVG
jgi:hypothetical protein